MESVYQDEAVYTEAAVTPQDRLRLQWSQQPGFLPFLRQKGVIDGNPELVPYAGTAGLHGWIPPRLFALEGLVLLSLVAAFLNWQVTRHAGKLEDQIAALHATVQTEVSRQEGIIAATQAEIRRISNSSKPSFKLHLSETPLTREQALQTLNSSLDETQNSEEQFKERAAAQEHKLRTRQSILAIVNSGSPLIFSIALVLAAGLVGSGMPRDFARSRQSKRLKDFYLYFAAAEGLWPNLVLIIFLHIALSRSAYGIGSVFESVGPLFWVVFAIGFYFLLLRYFVMVSRDMYQAADIRRPANEWGPENRMLWRIHSSFVVVFAAMEAAFLAGCYALYLAQKTLT